VEETLRNIKMETVNLLGQNGRDNIEYYRKPKTLITITEHMRRELNRQGEIS
jgi:hypothetical protein